LTDLFALGSALGWRGRSA